MRLTYILLALLSVVAINSADRRSGFHDFKHLIPRKRIIFLAGQHLVFDEKFRLAFNYLRSTNFEALVRDEIASNQEVKDVIDYLGQYIDLNRIPEIFRNVIIRMRPVHEYGHLKRLTSFIREVADILPNEKIKKLIQEKKDSNPEFAMLYERVTDSQFKELVYKASNSNSLAGAIKTLRNNQVDVDQVLDIAFELLGKWTM